jgi:hypothetical protein
MLVPIKLCAYVYTRGTYRMIPISNAILRFEMCLWLTTRNYPNYLKRGKSCDDQRKLFTEITYPIVDHSKYS